ncbi:hypothetical protein AAHB54_06310, partial [Bacillus cereus]
RYGHCSVFEQMVFNLQEQTKLRVSAFIIETLSGVLIVRNFLGENYIFSEWVWSENGWRFVD